MDIFCEYMVKRKRDIKDFGIIFLIIIAAIILSFAVLLAVILFNRYLFGFDIFIFAGILYGAFILIKSRDLEYEYILTTNELDIDKIIGKRKRKKIMTVDFKYIEVCACVKDERYISQYNNKPQKITDVTGESENDIYFVDFNGSNGRERVLFQPSDKMKESLRLVNPGAVHLS